MSLSVGYLTSQYARASDSFIRGEVEQLRSLGCTVHTFSIRAPDESQMVSAEIVRERNATDDILGHSFWILFYAFCCQTIAAPGRALTSLRLSFCCSTPGIKGRLWAVGYWFEAAYLARQLRAKRIEHLHNHIGEGSATVAMLAAHMAGITFSLTIHGPNEFDRPTLIALDQKIRHAAFTVAISRFGRSQILRWAEFEDWHKVHVVRCGVGDKFLTQNTIPVTNNRQFVSVGRLAEQKGQMILVEAISRLVQQGERDFHVTLIGDGPLRGPIEEAIRRDNLQPYMTLAGWQGADSVQQTIEQSSALVLPSFAEGLPVVFMESLALGRPVIATQIAGHPELIDERVGWLVPPGDSLALAAAMANALASNNLAEMGCEGRRRVEWMHDASKEAARLLRLITTAVKEGRVPAWAPELDETYAVSETASHSESTPYLVQNQPERASIRF